MKPRNVEAAPADALSTRDPATVNAYRGMRTRAFEASSEFTGSLRALTTMMTRCLSFLFLGQRLQVRRRAVGEELSPHRGQSEIVDHAAIGQPHVLRFPEGPRILRLRVGVIARPQGVAIAPQPELLEIEIAAIGLPDLVQPIAGQNLPSGASRHVEIGVVSQEHRRERDREGRGCRGGERERHPVEVHAQIVERPRIEGEDLTRHQIGRIEQNERPVRPG